MQTIRKFLRPSKKRSAQATKSVIDAGKASGELHDSARSKIAERAIAEIKQKDEAFDAMREALEAILLHGGISSALFNRAQEALKLAKEAK